MIDCVSGFIPEKLADKYFEAAQSLTLEQPKAVFSSPAGKKEVPFPRLTAWFNDFDVGYAYTGQVQKRQAWPDWMLELRESIAKFTGTDFQSALVNFYRHGNDSVSWHQDNEKWFRHNPIIASVSLGQARHFELQRINGDKEKIRTRLAHGDLLIFSGVHVTKFKHQIPKEPWILNPRINITFRPFNAL